MEKRSGPRLESGKVRHSLNTAAASKGDCCAIRALAAETARPIFDRIGIHVGEVLVEEDGDRGKAEALYGIQADTCPLQRLSSRRPEQDDDAGSRRVHPFQPFGSSLEKDATISTHSYVTPRRFHPTHL